MIIICWLRTIWYTFESFINTGYFIPYIDGHMYKEMKNGSLKCMVCGKKE